MEDAHMVLNQPVDTVVTIPATQPTVPRIADLMPAKARSWVYAGLGVWTPIFGVWVGAGAPPSWVGYVTAGLSGAGFGVALSNVPRLSGTPALPPQ
jgi:hypothetical protein